jgi:NAD(P)-dependent dehydrogenase (short-subunit alcohol dehydrogenase family)
LSLQSLPGNTGLGLEVVKALAASENAYEIIIGCRTLQKGEDAIAAIKSESPNTRSSMSTVQADLSSDSSLEMAVQSISTKFGRLDVLINNGGSNFEHLQVDGKMTLREAWNASWDTNVVGTHILTTLAAPLLLQSANARLIFLASGTSTLIETERLDTPVYQRLNGSPEKGWPKAATPGPPVLGYRCSKTGLNMLMRDWHRTLLNDGVKVWAVSPGFLATNLGGVGPELLLKVRRFKSCSLIFWVVN